MRSAPSSKPTFNFRFGIGTPCADARAATYKLTVDASIDLNRSDAILMRVSMQPIEVIENFSFPIVSSKNNLVPIENIFVNVAYICN